MATRKKLQIYKSIARKGHSFPLSPTEIENIFGEIQGIEIGNVYYALRTSKKVIISSYYHGKLPSAPKQSDIWICSVHPDEKLVARKMLLEEAIPKIIHWLTEIKNQDDYWKNKDHVLTFRFINEELSSSLDEVWQH